MQNSDDAAPSGAVWPSASTLSTFLTPTSTPVNAMHVDGATTKIAPSAAASLRSENAIQIASPTTCGSRQFFAGTVSNSSEKKNKLPQEKDINIKGSQSDSPNRKSYNSSPVSPARINAGNSACSTEKSLANNTLMGGDSSGTTNPKNSYEGQGFMMLICLHYLLIKNIATNN